MRRIRLRTGPAALFGGMLLIALIVFLPTGFAGLLRRRREVSNRSAADAVN